MDLSHLSLNQATIEPYSFREAAEACVRTGISWIGPWRHKVAEIGLKESAHIVQDLGLKVSGLCRGGMFPAGTKPQRAARIDDNRRAIDEAVALGTNVLVLVCGPASDCDLDSARAMVEEGIEQLIPYAREANVKLGIEPLHPVFAADRSVISTLGQANQIVKRLQSPEVGVVIDVYHVWWDPELYSEIRKASGHILGFHVNDWTVPMGDPLMSRGMMGDGPIEINRIRRAVEEAGYDGPVEVEIFNQKIWDTDCDTVLNLMKERFQHHV